MAATSVSRVKILLPIVSQLIIGVLELAALWKLHTAIREKKLPTLNVHQRRQLKIGKIKRCNLYYYEN